MQKMIEFSTANWQKIPMKWEEIAHLGLKYVLQHVFEIEHLLPQSRGMEPTASKSVQISAA
ncbi:MAG: hypothetical protein ACI4BD_08115 [Paludibacteraceae bacterium]